MKQIRKFHSWVGYLVVFGAAVITVILSWVLYQHTVDLLTTNLKNREIAIVQTAAQQFDAADLAQLTEEDDWKKPVWNKVVNQLIKIRLSNKDIVFAYILRQSGDEMVFVADSHSLNPYAKIDLDQNGIIDDADALNFPGQIYEDVPSEAFEGYKQATTNKEIYEDQWGALISGYAPIKNHKGETVALMTVDIRANDFYKITTQTFFPFIAFIAILLIVLLILAELLIRIWNKRIELVVELDRQKDELLSIVSHQLATPITSVKWYIEMLLGGDLGKLKKEQEDHLKSMESISSTLSDLVSMILDVSRIQLGRVKIEQQSMDVNQFYREILEIMNPKAAEKGVKFIVNVPTNLPTMKLDKRYTRMTIENLISNAIKYTPKEGTVKFNVTLKGQKMYVEIADTGMGIPKADQDKIFGKLFRASNVRNSVDGNGFGLYIAKGAVEAQGGNISFVSNEGSGTTFFVELPINS